MSKVLIGRHAQVVDGHMIEPGQLIPHGVSIETRKRLERDGVVADVPKRSSKRSSSSDEEDH